MSRRWTGPVVAALGAALLVSSLAACSPDELGTAALVDGSRITTDDVQTQTRAYIDVIPSADRSTVQRGVLTTLILTRIIERVANDNDVAISDAAVAKQRTYIYSQTRGRDGLLQFLAQQQSVIVPPRYVNQWIRDQLALAGIAKALAGGDDPSSDAARAREQQALLKTARRMDIDVNPRYGTWLDDRGIRALRSGGLAFPPGSSVQ